MQNIIRIVSACVKPDVSIPIPDIKPEMLDDGLVGDETVEDEEWGEDVNNSELMDGPRYGEYEDDLGGEGVDDDD